MVRLLLVNAIVLVGLLGGTLGLVRAVILRRRRGLRHLSDRLNLGVFNITKAWWKCLWAQDRLVGVYRGHEIAVEKETYRSMGRLRHREIFRLACAYPGVPEFQLVSVSPFSHFLRKRNPRIVRTGDLDFDRHFALRTQYPHFVTELLDETIRARLLDTRREHSVNGVVRYSEGELSYAEPCLNWSSAFVDRLEVVAQRLYELCIAVKVFTSEDE